MAKQQGASGKKSQRDRGITTVTNKARIEKNFFVFGVLFACSERFGVLFASSERFGVLFAFVNNHLSKSIRQNGLR